MPPALYGQCGEGVGIHMNSSTPGGLLLVASATSSSWLGQLPLLIHINLDAIYSMIVAVAWLWGISYMTTALAMHYLRK
jgi:hypothetical protein